MNEASAWKSGQSCDRECTRRAGKVSQSRHDAIRHEDGVVCYLGAVFDDCELPLEIDRSVIIGYGLERSQKVAHDDTVLPDFNMTPNSGSFNNTIGTNVDIVSDFHRVVVEIAPECLIWWSDITEVSGLLES